MVSAVEDRYAKLFKIFHKQENFTTGWDSDVIWSHGKLFHVASLNLAFFV